MKITKLINGKLENWEAIWGSAQYGRNIYSPGQTTKEYSLG